MKATARQRGFTLIELLIALVLVSMVSLLLGGALRLGTQAWAKVNARQDQAEHDFLLAQMLRRHLASARFVTMQTSDGANVTGFIGAPDRVTFIAPYPSYDNDGALYWWTLEVAADAAMADDALQLSYVRYDADQTVDARGDATITVTQNYEENGLSSTSELDPETLVIAPEVSAITLSYFYRNAMDEGQWVEGWDPTDEEFANTTPELIRLIVTTTDAQRHEITLPEITVAPHLIEQRLYARAGQ